jgi:hypothetical protein
LSEEELWEKLIDCTLSLPAVVVHLLLVDGSNPSALPLAEVERMLATEDRPTLRYHFRMQIELGGSPQSIERLLAEHPESSL